MNIDTGDSSDCGTNDIAGVGERIDTNDSAVWTCELLQKAGDFSYVATEIEACVEAELLELAKVDLADEKFAEERVVAACGGVYGEVTSEHMKAQNTAHFVIGRVEFAFTNDSGSVLQDGAVPSQRLRFWHYMPSSDYIIGEASKLLSHSCFIIYMAAK